MLCSRHDSLVELQFTTEPVEVGKVGAFPVGACTLADSTSSIGAGAAISEGRKMRALTATSANKNTSKTKNGAMY